MEGDSDIIRAVSMTTINCSKMTICPHTVCCSLSSLGESTDMVRMVMEIQHPALAFIMGENQLVEARDRFQLNRGKTFQWSQCASTGSSELLVNRGIQAVVGNLLAGHLNGQCSE